MEGDNIMNIIVIIWILCIIIMAWLSWWYYRDARYFTLGDVFCIVIAEVLSPIMAPFCLLLFIIYQLDKIVLIDNTGTDDED